MCDYDVIPIALTPDFAAPAAFTGYSAHVPSLMVGTADQWTALLMAMLTESEEMLANGKIKEAGDAPLSDMIALLAVHIKDAKAGTYRYQQQRRVVESPELLKAAVFGNFTTRKDVTGFCNQMGSGLVMHLSHHACALAGVARGSDRAPYMRKARRVYYNLCVKPVPDR